ncbi:MAG TPA: DinB family protein [Rubricoccaceae bacterium]|nr:DinB family protein [Rubricoccaceae bacterium]
MLTRPASDEFAPYYERYVAAVPEGHPLDLLQQQRDEVWELVASVPSEKERHRYAEGKWSVREVLGHMADAERVFGHRAHRIARGDATPLPGFDENAYVAASWFDVHPLAVWAEDFGRARALTLHLFEHLPAEAFARRGTASGYGVSVRALLYICLGHAAHHLGVLRTRYLAD